MNDTKPSPKMLTSKEQIVLEQMRQHHRETIATFRSLDGKAQKILEVSSIVITVIAGFQLATFPNLYKGALLFSILLYIATAFSAFKVLFPKTLQHEPIQAKWDEIRDSLNQDDAEFFYSVLSGYEDAIAHNRQINSDKEWFVRLTFILLSATVTVTLLAVLFR